MQTAASPTIDPITTGMYVIVPLRPDDVDETSVAQFNTVMRQLSKNAEPYTVEDLQELLRQRGVTIFVAVLVSTNEIVGMSTHTISQQPVRGKAWVEDVVVLSDHRGHKLGLKLMLALIMLTQRLGPQVVKKLDLTTGNERNDAHGLYMAIGFQDLTDGEPQTNAADLFSETDFEDRASRLMRHKNPHTFDLTPYDTSGIHLPA